MELMMGRVILIVSEGRESVSVLVLVMVLVLLISLEVDDAVGGGRTVVLVNVLCKENLLEILPFIVPGLLVLGESTLVHVDVVVLSEVVVLRLVDVLADVEVVTMVPLTVEYPEELDDLSSVLDEWWELVRVRCGRVMSVFVEWAEWADSKVLEEWPP